MQKLNLSDVAQRHGYKTFSTLLQDSGVMDLLKDDMYQPLTVFLPSDAAMASLPPEQRDFLFHQDNRAQLAEYLKYHILLGQKIYAEGLIYLDSARSLQGSTLSFTCGGTDAIGEIFVNDGKCRIVQRHLVFTGGIAYGIDCLLTPPSLGGRCDKHKTMDMQMSCGICTSSASRCPKRSKLKETQKCDLPFVHITKNSGCRSICTVSFWQPKCCHGYYGRDCLGETTSVDARLGVFHLRSGDGQYKLNFSAAQQACAAEGARLATYTQLSYAQQGGLNLCSAGWLDGARVAYPTTYSNPNCGFGHVGIVDYGVRKEGEVFDAFCFRMKEVNCECRPGFVGDGFSCTGNLLQVLQSTPRFSNFLTQILNCSAESESGRLFVQRLGNMTVQKTLFVPENSGLPGNQTLSQRDVDFHLSEGRVLSLAELRNGTRIRTRVGSLSVLGVSDLLDPSNLV
ncbi:stabilin-2-like [Etheostoma cragini]|uniref:stabilin-2-like n=1 Tax=Etheostoma cragini TaxID=417921 RepID=UPI00155EC609|nr:stabilin-2-like [Etheostoma cragini]